MFNQVARKTVMMASTVAMLAGCSKGSGGYSLLTDNTDYKQQAVIIPKKIDILWVIDNSGSMRSSQTNLTNNFSSFINRFKDKNFDFHMAVAATDGWKKRFNSASELARIRDGGRILDPVTNAVVADTHSGVFVMTKDTPNLTNVFTTNATQGTAGAGDERAFESMKQTLLEPFNANFRRPEAFLAIIIVSDEEDFSHGTSSMNESYANPDLQTVESFKTFLDGFTEIGTYGKNYSVSTITVEDQACLDSLDNNAQKLAPRVQKLADLTGGTRGSICSNFGQTLELISDSIINLSAVFKLNREPQIDTISVTVDGVVVQNDAANGWTYNAADMTITFHGSAVPAANANIKIDFYPKSIQL